MGCSTQHEPDLPAKPVKEVVLEDLKRPWSMAFLSEDEVLITEKDGHLLKVHLPTGSRTIIRGIPMDRADSVLTKPADATSLHYPRGIRAGLKTTFNEGLLDIVLDPAFQTNQRLFLSYVSEADSGTTTRVISATLESDSLTNMKTILLAAPHSDGSFHYGGALVFGKDATLYATVGDRLFSEANQPPLPIAQDLSDSRGMIYRFNADGSVPSDNPMLGPDARPGAFAYGIRNVQGIALHPESGDLWFSEHGTIQGDELNLLQAGANYGWPYQTTGRYRAPGFAPVVPDTVTLTPPKWYWQHTVAPTGLVFYTGDDFADWKNNLLVAGLSRGSLWRFRIEDNTIKSAEELFIDNRVRARNIAQSPGGVLYLLTDAPNGQVLRIRNSKTPTQSGSQLY
ncbi:MAG: PQQ-dependent sugar dehydrogenase [Rhodothermaceae bacterium]|nr:PQQ-dependent sugar dehydrogenase [Rhodothermaceae bacterium]